MLTAFYQNDPLREKCQCFYVYFSSNYCMLTSFVSKDHIFRNVSYKWLTTFEIQNHHSEVSSVNLYFGEAGRTWNFSAHPSDRNEIGASVTSVTGVVLQARIRNHECPKIYSLSLWVFDAKQNLVHYFFGFIPYYCFFF